MEENDAVQKPVVVDPPLYNEAPPSVSPRRPVVIAADAAPRPENQLIQRIQRALEELRELRNQFNAILREIELEGSFSSSSSSSICGLTSLLLKLEINIIW